MEEKLQSSTSRRDILRFAGGLAAGGAAGIVASGAPLAAEGALAAPKQSPGDITITINGALLPAVQSVESIESETEITSHTEGSELITHFRPGNHKPGKMVITREWSLTGELFDWYNLVLMGPDPKGADYRKSVSVIFHNDAGEEAGRMNFYNCWPTKWTGPSLNARNSAHATEKLEIVFDTMELKAK